MKNEIIASVRHGLILSVAALLCGAFWAAYMATHHEQLHSAFEAQETKIQSAQMGHLMEDLSMDAMQLDHAHEAGAAADHGHQSHDAGGHATDGQHSHSGSLAKDAMQRLLRGHIHFMGIGVLAAVLLLVTAFTSLKPFWKKYWAGHSVSALWPIRQPGY